uniref:Uncharacterized protein n=1 Tax=Lepeophtheirus salmonis TaxID=72036 RepID=A0A0K2V591_LEPSM
MSRKSWNNNGWLEKSNWCSVCVCYCTFFFNDSLSQRILARKNSRIGILEKRLVFF